MHTYSFEKLEVWQLSRVLVKNIYSLTANFPVEERYGLISQLRRASVSIGSNLAEGSTRDTNRDKAHFTKMAFGSLMELLNQLIVSTDLEFLSNEKLSTIRPKIEEIGNKLNALRNSQLNR